MKLFNKLLAVAMLATLFISCGSDDEGLEPVVKNVVKEYTFRIPVKGIKNQEQKSIKTTIDMTPFLGADTIKNITKIELQRGQSSFAVLGISAISDTVKLNNFTIEIGTKFTKNYGICSPAASAGLQSDIVHSSDSYTNIAKYILEDFKASNKSDIYLTFTPNIDLDSKTTVFVEIKVGAIYYFNTYPNK